MLNILWWVLVGFGGTGGGGVWEFKPPSLGFGAPRSLGVNELSAGGVTSSESGVSGSGFSPQIALMDADSEEDFEGV